MILETPKQAYNEILVSGLLSDEKFLVYQNLYKHGPLTGGECFMKMQEENLGHNVVKGSVCARLTELGRLGCAIKIGKKICNLTGKNVNLWKVTNRLPIKSLPRKDRVKCTCCKGKGYLLVAKVREN